MALLRLLHVLFSFSKVLELAADILIQSPSGSTIDALSPSSHGTITGVASGDLIESVVHGYLTPCPPNHNNESAIFSPDTDMDIHNLDWRVDFSPVLPGNCYALLIVARVVYNDEHGIQRTVSLAKTKTVVATLP